jgi:hypothetical protein
VEDSSEMMIHEEYLPFTEDELRSHFYSDNKNIKKIIESANRYKEFFKEEKDLGTMNIGKMKKPCQIQKDETVWTASSLMTVYHGKNRTRDFVRLLEKAKLGYRPKAEGFDSWDSCFEGNLHLYFEVKIPSPKSYRTWLKDNLRQRQLIPYILDSSGAKKGTLEGGSYIDAMVINSDNGFCITFEAKVLSDISTETNFDGLRNQIARNLDALIDRNDRLRFPLNKRDPSRTVYLLITPASFKENPDSRLYGYKMREYRENPDAIGRDLPHRIGVDWDELSTRIGWITWEDFKEVNDDCCKWIR